MKKGKEVQVGDFVRCIGRFFKSGIFDGEIHEIVRIDWPAEENGMIDVCYMNDGEFCYECNLNFDFFEVVESSDEISRFITDAMNEKFERGE